MEFRDTLTRDEIYKHVLTYEISCSISQVQLLATEERKLKEREERLGRKIWS